MHGGFTHQRSDPTPITYHEPQQAASALLPIGPTSACDHRCVASRVKGHMGADPMLALLGACNMLTSILRMRMFMGKRDGLSPTALGAPRGASGRGPK